MIILHDNLQKAIDFQTYIALGSFDGLHLGHMELINKTLELSKDSNVKSLIYTFKNHPLNTISPEKAPKLIMDNEAKLDLLDKLGIDIVSLVEFNMDYMKVTPEDFIRNLINNYNPKGIIVGFNYRFGFKNTGDVELLSKFSKSLGFQLHIIDSVYYDEEIVSSTRIRALVTEGRVEEANKMLLVPFMLKGKVVKGKQLGRELGFPTANLEYNSSLILPAIGVYYTNVKYKDKLYKGITSVGYNPTVEKNTSRIFVETYILDFDGCIYSEDLEVYFIERMRNEIKFKSLNDLTDQLKKDKAYAESQKLEIFA